MTKKLLLPCLAAGLVVLGLACDSASPVAPSGTVLTISASPNEISTTGSSVIRVTAVRANGTPVNPGTIVRLATTLGEIDEQAETDESGVARATLVGDGRIGTATVSARSGSAEEVSVEVMVGRVASSVSLQATPTQISAEGGSIDLLAVVRDEDGEPLQGATVNFQTEVGRLSSGGSLIRSDSLGEARDSLVVEDTDLEPVTANSFSVSVEVGAAGSNQTDTASIRINRREPTADFTAENLGNNRVRVFNNTTGDEPIDYFWDYDEDGEDDAFGENPPDYEYDSPGSKTILLRAENEFGEDTTTQTVNVTSGPVQ